MPTLPLPLFPLGNVVLFPGMVLPLHIFEERYVRMLRSALAGTRRFGVCLIRTGEEVGGPAEPYDVGTVARISEHREVAPNDFIVLAVGEDRFHITRQWHDGTLLLGEVETFDDQPADDEPALAALRSQAEALATRHLGLMAEATGRPFDPPNFPDSPVEVSFLLASGLTMESGPRQELLEMTDTGQRLATITGLLTEQVDVLAYRVEHRDDIHRVVGGNGHLKHDHLAGDSLDDAQS